MTDATQQPTPDLERIAAALWKAEATNAGVPASVIERRTPEAFREQSDAMRERWFKFARAALEAAPRPSQEVGDEACDHTAVGCPVLRESDPPCDGCDCHKRHDAALTPAPGHEAEPVACDDLIERLLDAQQDVNLAANSYMDQSLANVSALMDEIELRLRRCAHPAPAPDVGEEEPWCDCKVAFDIDWSDEMNALFAEWCENPERGFPPGWSFDGWDLSGARSVAIFRVEGQPSIEHGRAILSRLARKGA